MKKKTRIIIGAVAVLVAVIAAVAGVLYYSDYQATYIVIDGEEYLRSVTSLDLSGKTLTEVGKLKELTNLESLDLRDTGISMAQYDGIQAALPDCYIHWSVPFQDGYCDNETVSLKLESLSEKDFSALAYLKNLETVTASGCTDYGALLALTQQYPELKVTYWVSFSGTDYSNKLDTIRITDPDLDELYENLQYLPKVQTVYLNGTLPSNEELLTLKETLTGITFVWDFEVFGVEVNTLTEFIDLSGIEMENTDEVEAMLPYFYNLTQVDMVDCGISNDDMDALNRRHQDTKFVWKVKVGGTSIRTDATYFMPAKTKIKGINARSCVNLKYCTDMVAIDFGHYCISNVDFVEYMPNLKYLLLCEATMTDITAISNCKSLVYLELFLTDVTDYWPLTNLTNLEDLNISYTPYGDITPLYQMTWLDRMWMASSGVSRTQRTSLRTSLPNTIFLFYSDGSTNRGWRHSPNYYEQRDLIGMWYMVA